MNPFIKLYCLFLFVVYGTSIYAQSYNDGPIKVDVTLQEVQGFFEETDEALLGVGFAPDELVFYIWAKDNLGTYPWTGGTCFQDPNFDPTLSGTNSINFNSTFASFSFLNTIVPQFLDLRIDAWEDDNPDDGLLGFCGNGTSTSFEDIQCSGFPVSFLCGWGLCPNSCITYYTNLQTGATSSDCCVGIFCSDDYRCNADPFFLGLDYRLGPPCQTYDHGYVNGNNSCDPNYSLDPSQPNTDGFYKPHIETFWRYINGTSFAKAIDLGTLPAYPSNIQHFNSNECYTDYYTLSAGNDVIYSFDITNSTGVNISLCGATGAQFDSYLYLVEGNDTTIAIDFNDNSCGASQSQISTSLCTPGTYYVIVDATTPSEYGTFTLTITEDPINTFSVIDSISDYNGEDISCPGGNDGKFYAQVNGGTPAYTYAWTGPNGFTATTNDSITGLSAGTYTVTVTDSKGCTITGSAVTLNDPSPIVITTNSTPASCFGYSDGTIMVSNISGGTPLYSYSWDSNPIQTGANAIALPSGTYTLTVTDNNLCSITHQDIVTEPSAPSMNIISSTGSPINNSPITYEVCNGDNITLTASGSGFASYSWSPNIWLNTTSGPTVISSPNSPGITYTCTGTDLSGCTIDIPILVDVVSSVVMYVNPPLSQVCEGEDIEVTWYSDPGTNFSWFPPTYLSSTSAIAGQPITINPQDTITYTITAQNPSGCTDQTTYFIDILPAPNINTTSPITSICYGSSVPITVSGANSYSWFPSSSLNSNIGNVVTASPTISTQYKVIGTAANGCKDSSYTTISVNPLPVLNVTGTNNICEGESTTLLVSGATSYIWTPSTSLNTTIGNIVLANPSTSQTYTIIGTDINQCEGTVSYSVSVLPTPNISVTTSEDTICIGSSSNLIANGALSYNWTPSSSLNINTGNSVTATPTITTTYSVLGTNADNCSSTSLMTINVNPLPILNVTPAISTICEGNNVAITASGADDFIWSPALGLNTTIGSTIIANPITTSFYTITGTDINGCSDVISASVNVNPQPVITLSSIPNTHDICEGASININAFGALSYSWSPPFGLNSTVGQSVVASPTTSTYYTITGTDINSCTNIANFQLNVGINPTVSITPNNPIICEGESVALLADGANQYVWTPSNTLSSGVGTMVTATPSISTSYTVTGTDNLGCIDSISTTISVNPLPTAYIIQDSLIICTGDTAAISVEISGTPPWDLLYAINGALQENMVDLTSDPIIISSNIAGEYTLITITDDNGCNNIGNGSLFLDVINTPIAGFLPAGIVGDMLHPDISFINTSTEDENIYSWYFGDFPFNGTSSLQDPIYTYHDPGTYEVILVAMNGPCIDSDTNKITIQPVYTLYIPNSFSPDNDGLNDYFPWDSGSPKGKSITDFKIYIYNTWGEEVFYSDNILNTWNGKMKDDGEIVAGYYGYVIQITDDLGVHHTISGQILLN